MSDIHEITKNLGQAYEKAKEWTISKEIARERFFEAIDQELGDTLPVRSTIEIEASDEEQALRIAQRRFQRHRVMDAERVDDKHWNLILEEDPHLKEFTYVNPEDGKVYKRIIAEGSPVLDDEGIKQENPELWESITVEVTNRVLKSMDDLTPEQQAAVEPYITMGKPQQRLAAPRKAKQEELDENDH